jgi:hypothetical protein
MLERFNHLAQAAATGVSRREFLGRVGRGAMVAASAAGGLLAVARDASAARCPPGYHPCRRNGVNTCCSNRGGR